MMLLGSVLYLGIGLWIWVTSLVDGEARADDLEIIGGLAMVVLWLPTFLILLCVPLARRRQWNRQAQQYVREIRARRDGT